MATIDLARRDELFRFFRDYINEVLTFAEQEFREGRLAIGETTERVLIPSVDKYTPAGWTPAIKVVKAEERRKPCRWACALVVNKRFSETKAHKEAVIHMQRLLVDASETSIEEMLKALVGYVGEEFAVKSPVHTDELAMASADCLASEQCAVTTTMFIEGLTIGGFEVHLEFPDVTIKLRQPTHTDLEYPSPFGSVNPGCPTLIATAHYKAKTSEVDSHATGLEIRMRRFLRLLAPVQIGVVRSSTKCDSPINIGPIIPFSH
ncbi:MAG: hypothetical protein WC712_09835 [Candidatus Brocadiia bacterium]